MSSPIEYLGYTDPEKQFFNLFVLINSNHNTYGLIGRHSIINYEVCLLLEHHVINSSHFICLLIDCKIEGANFDLIKTLDNSSIEDYQTEVIGGCV